MKRRLGDVSVPAIGMGCMGLSEFYGHTDSQVALKALEDAYAIGYRHFDTADIYGNGENEALIGKFLQNHANNREEIVISTKVGIVRDPDNKYSLSINGRPSYIRETCEASLKRLQSDYIDIYYLHRIDPEVALEESLDALNDLIDEGKIRSVGLCEVNADIIKKVNSILPIAAVQSEYSLWSREIEDKVLPTCEQLDIALVAFCPLGRGFLTGKIDRNFMASADQALDFRLQLPRFADQNIDKNLLLVNQLKELSLNLDIQPAQLALTWLLHKSPVIHSIPGSKSQNHLKSNFESQHLCLDSAIIGMLDEIFDPSQIHGLRYPQKILEKSL